MQRVVPVLRVADFAAAQRFYKEALGFATDWVWQPEASAPGFAQISRGGLSLYLSGDTADADFGPSTAYVYVDDVDAWQLALEEAGVAIETPATTRPWGNRELSLRDPDGNRLTLATPSPAPRRDDGS